MRTEAGLTRALQRIAAPLASRTVRENSFATFAADRAFPTALAEIDGLSASMADYSADGPNIRGTAIDNVTVVVVPEPSSLSLLAGAACLLLGRFSYAWKKLTT